jgi:sigma-E factor negative regulatory protein RseB
VTRTLGALLLFTVAGWAQAQTTPEALDWLRKIYQATEKLSYSGTFVYQQGDRTETSRITRLAGAAGGTEKLEVLDGTPREILRTRDEIRCYLPESRTVKVDRRSDPREFPALLPAQVDGLSEHYVITLGPMRRIAGFDCQAIVLTPKDDLRYGYRMWADARTGMLLKAQTFDRDGHTMEQFAFTHLEIGNVPRERLRPPRSAQGWRVEQAGVAPADLSQSGWRVSVELPGFRKIVEIRRMLRDTQPVGQMVYSDGLAAVSVFIEPMPGHAEPARFAISSTGADNLYPPEVATHLLTVVGEAPPASEQRIGNPVDYRPQ